MSSPKRSSRDASFARVLLLDATGPETQITVLINGQVIAQRLEEKRYGHAAFLPPLLQEILSEASCKAQDLTALVVAAGPGSFTGIRASMALARGLADGLGIPCFAIPSFQAFAWSLEEPSLIALESWRSELFWAFSETPDSPWIAEAVPALEMNADALPLVGSALLASLEDQRQPTSLVRLDPSAVLQGLSTSTEAQAKYQNGPAVFLRPPDVDEAAAKKT